jgi:hypothetical protein
VNELFPIYPIHPAALGPGVYSVSNRNEYRKQKNKCLWGVERGIPNISKPYRPPGPVTGIALLFFKLFFG